MSWWEYAIESTALAFFVVCALAAAPVVVAGEAGVALAGVGMTVGEALAVETTSALGGSLAASAIVTTAIADYTRSKTRGRNVTDPFDEPPATRPRPDFGQSDDDDEEEMEDVMDTPGLVTGVRGPETNTETLTQRLTAVRSPRGDYAGIQKTMFNPVTGSIIGLKLHSRNKRGVFGGNFHVVKHLLRRSNAPVKVTYHSPVSVLGMRSP